MARRCAIGCSSQSSLSSPDALNYRTLRTTPTPKALGIPSRSIPGSASNVAERLPSAMHSGIRDNQLLVPMMDTFRIFRLRVSGIKLASSKHRIRRLQQRGELPVGCYTLRFKPTIKRRSRRVRLKSDTGNASIAATRRRISTAQILGIGSAGTWETAPRSA